MAKKTNEPFDPSAWLNEAPATKEEREKSARQSVKKRKKRATRKLKSLRRKNEKRMITNLT